MKGLSLAGLALLLLVVPLLAACRLGTAVEAAAGYQEQDPTATVDDPALAEAVSLAEARDIAMRSECATVGALREGGFYNDSTDTWWIDLDADQDGCVPACVVWAATKEAEVNWRCTGALADTPASSPADSGGQSLPGKTVRSSRQRVPAPDMTDADLAELTVGKSAFAFDLYQALRGTGGNLFLSPYSISMALAMTYAGARGETAAQMADTLHFTLPQDRLHPTLNGLAQALACRGEGSKGKDGKGFRLNVVNALWGQEGYQFLSSFLDLLAEDYGAGLRTLDFVGAPELARTTINDWVSDQTEGRIEDLIPQGLINGLTRLILTNAIYFNAAWSEPFEASLTRDGPFYLLDGGQVVVAMMRQTESLSYADGEEYQAIELPYDGRELSMVILLPRAGQFEAFERELDAGRVDGIIKELAPKRVALTMPMFQFESGFSLKDALAAMGMPAAFSEAADFSGMTGQRELSIADVIHKAFVSVDETGTEAAAATAAVMRLTAMLEEPIEMHVDHPFIFLIRDIETGTVLFIGRVINPAG